VVRIAGRMADGVLDEERHARERPGRAGRIVSGAVESPMDDGVEAWVDALDPFDRGVDELPRRDAAVCDERGLGGGIEQSKFVGHGRAA
jgi:hypothetical protein